MTPEQITDKILDTVKPFVSEWLDSSYDEMKVQLLDTVKESFITHGNNGAPNIPKDGNFSMRYNKDSANELPIDYIVKMITTQKEGDGLLLIATNGIIEATKPSPNVKGVIILAKPEAVTQALFNQAVTMGEFDWINHVLNTMYSIVRSTTENIDIHLRERKNKN